MIDTKEIMNKLNESGILMTAKIEWPILSGVQSDVSELICAIPNLCSEIDDLLKTNSELVFQIEALRKSCLEKNCDHIVKEHERALKLEKVLIQIEKHGESQYGAWSAFQAREALAKEEE